MQSNKIQYNQAVSCKNIVESYKPHLDFPHTLYYNFILLRGVAYK